MWGIRYIGWGAVENRTSMSMGRDADIRRGAILSLSMILVRPRYVDTREIHSASRNI